MKVDNLSISCIGKTVQFIGADRNLSDRYEFRAKLVDIELLTQIYLEAESDLYGNVIDISTSNEFLVKLTFTDLYYREIDIANSWVQSKVSPWETFSRDTKIKVLDE